MDYEKLFKKLLMMNQIGVYLDTQSGHTWINRDYDSLSNFHFDKIMLNNKIYHGVIEAIDTFDEALKRDGQSQLLEMWDESEVILGKGGVDESRIDEVKSGEGRIC